MYITICSFCWQIFVWFNLCLFFAVRNNVAMDFHFLQVNFHGLLLEVKLRACEICVSLVLVDVDNLFSKMVIPMNTSSTKLNISPIFPHHHQYLIIMDYLISTSLMDIKWYLIVLIFIFLITAKVERIFICAVGHSNFLCYTLLVHIFYPSFY